jgi:hypothetical protein
MMKLLTEKQVSEQLGLHVQTLRNHRFLGKGIPYLKIGRAVRYDPEAIRNYLETATVDTQSRSDVR